MRRYRNGDAEDVYVRVHGNVRVCRAVAERSRI